MSIIVEEAQEADIQRMIDIMYTGFSKDPWNRIMYPETPPPESRGPSVERWRHDIASNPTMRFMKAVDTNTDTTIAFAKWSIYEVERPDSEWKAIRPRDWDVGTNVEAANEFYNAVCEARHKFMGGTPHRCLNMLVCEPKFQRRGAGLLLLRWGLNLADGLALKAYLEASPEGLHLYEGAGFKAVGTIDLEMSKYGGHGIHRHVIMIRELSSPSNPRC